MAALLCTFMSSILASCMGAIFFLSKGDTHTAWLFVDVAVLLLVIECLVYFAYMRFSRE